MKSVPAALLLACLLATSLLGACSTTGTMMLYEQDDLVTVEHNNENAYTLLVYEDPLGQTRHVLRRFGVCEMVITYTATGEIRLKQRGRRERSIDVVEASRLTERVNALFQATTPQPTSADRLSSID